MSGTKQKNQIRRIVTGHDENGTAVVWIDGPATNIKSIGTGKITATLMWSTEETPADFQKKEDYGDRILGTAPPSNGTRFIIFELQPESGRTQMHKTDTIDYIICLQGEINMHLDDSVINLRQGDVLIQRGTIHAWENCSDIPAKLAIVLIDGKPKREGAISGSENAG